MKALMIQVVHHCYLFLKNRLFASDITVGAVIEHLKKNDPEPKWNDPAQHPRTRVIWTKRGRRLSSSVRKR
jgi:hypothetical protein